MARTFKTADYASTLDLKISLRDALPPEHLARFIVDLVGQLNFSHFYERYGSLGGSPYAPELLFSLLVYGYCTGVFSSRKIERATYESLPFRFLSVISPPIMRRWRTFGGSFSMRFRGCS